MEQKQRELPLLITKTNDPIDSVIANAIKVIIESTKHEVTYSTERFPVYVSKWMNHILTHHEIEVKIKIKIPVN